MNPKILDIIKKGLGFVVSIGAGAVVSNIAKEAVKDENRVIRMAATVAASVVGGMVGDKAAEYLGEQLDTINDTVIAKLEEGKKNNE